jgi:parvulin-like peptidyl-prolyl cis-trans isomerase-like protein
VKRFLLLLLVLAGGLVAAALTIPTNAAVVNGTSISQQSLNSDVSAIAGSAYYQCYLNSQAYLGSSGAQQLPTVAGAGKGQDGAGNHPTANSAFVATYLDTEIGHRLVQQLADTRHVTVTPAQLADARTNLEGQISAVMTQILQTAQGQDPRYSCTVTGSPLTGAEVLATLPASFVDQQVQFVATASAVQEELAGVGSSDAELQGYFLRHHAEFDTVCLTAAAFSSQAAAQEAAAAIAFGTPFSEVAAKATQTGQLQCAPLADIAGQLPSSVKLGDLAVGAASAPVNVNGAYYLLELTKRTPTAYAAARTSVAQAVQQVGAKATQKAITAVERHSSVSVDPRYGVWVPVAASVFTPLTPSRSDVLNSSANQATSVAAGPISG